jgi:chromate reductase
VATCTVGYFVGSLAKASINRELANALVRLAPAELSVAPISASTSSGWVAEIEGWG